MAYADRQTRLDSSFRASLVEIEHAYTELPKFLRIRVEHWVSRLSEPVLNLTWKQTRNAYATLLLHMVRRREFADPFSANPPPGPLPSLPADVVLRARNLARQRRSKFWAGVLGEPKARRRPPAPQPAQPAPQAKHMLPMPPPTAPTVPEEAVRAATRREDVAWLETQLRKVEDQLRERNEKVAALEKQLWQQQVDHAREVRRMALAHQIQMSEAGGAMGAMGAVDPPPAPTETETESALARLRLAAQRFGGGITATVVDYGPAAAASDEEFLVQVDEFQQQTEVLIRMADITP